MPAIFNERFFDNNQPHNDLLYVRQAGRLGGDPDYAIERAGSPTNVIGCVQAGALYISAGESRHVLRRGDCFALPHDMSYRISSDAQSPAEMLWLNLRGSLMNDMMDRLFDGGAAVAACALEKGMQDVIALIAAPGDRMADIARAVFALLLDIRAAWRAGGIAHSPPVGPGQLFDEYICQNMRNPFSVAAMARHFALSPEQLGRQFRAELGTTPHKYYQSIRLDFARSLLANTSLTIDDIAGRLGYVDRNYFTLCFTRGAGMPPARYRRLHARGDG